MCIRVKSFFQFLCCDSIDHIQVFRPLKLFKVGAFAEVETWFGVICHFCDCNPEKAGKDLKMVQTIENAELTYERWQYNGSMTAQEYSDSPTHLKIQIENSSH